MKKTIHAALLAAAFAFAPWPAWSHGGEDHGDEAKAAPLPGAAAAPRAVAQTEDFELVAVLEGKTLTLTLDRFASNEPVIDARLEIDGGVVKGVAKQVAPGVYALAGEGFVAPGKYHLAISVEAGETTDLMTATLELAAPVAVPAHTHAASEWITWGSAAALLVAGGGLIAVRRRHKHRKSR